jgi:aspartyl protease family protein
MIRATKTKIISIIGLIFFLGVQAVAEPPPSVHVVGLFKDRALVVIDGKRHLLRVGQRSPEGVELMSADSDQAQFRVGEAILTRALDGRVGAPGKAAQAEPEVQIFRDTSGMYSTVGSINGLPVRFLVDTGATNIALNAAQARRLGIDYRVEGEPTWVSTASAVEQAYSVRLDQVRVGAIELRNVQAVVIDGPQPEEVLLGMSFLNRVHLRNEGAVMTLQKKF